MPEAPTPAPAASSKAPGGRKAKAAAKAAAAAAAAAAKAQATAVAEAASNDARCDISGADAAQEMLLAVVEGHPERLQDAMQLLLRTAQSHAQEVCITLSNCRITCAPCTPRRACHFFGIGLGGEYAI